MLPRTIIVKLPPSWAGFSTMFECAVIDWAGFTWQAFATLVTGFLAVGAATWVARRQIKLQSQIAATANETALLKIKTDLFDKRVAVYEDVRVWLDTIINTANNATSQDHATMRAAMDRSQFLFAESVTYRLHRLFDAAATHSVHRGDLDPAARAKADAAWKYLFDKSNGGLYHSFGEELRLGSPAPYPQFIPGRASGSTGFFEGVKRLIRRISFQRD